MSSSIQSNNVQNHHHRHHHHRHHHGHHDKKTGLESDSLARVENGITDQINNGNEVLDLSLRNHDSYNMRHLSETVILRVPVSQPCRPEPPTSPSPSLTASAADALSIAPVSDSDSSDAEPHGLNNKLAAPPSPSR